MNTQSDRSKRKESIVLLAVAAMGIFGLLALQLFRQYKGADAETDKSVVQTTAANANLPAEAKGTTELQELPTKLVVPDRYPHQNEQFTYRIANFSPGIVYELDLGDGNRKPFDAQGALTHTYRKPGDHKLTLYAIYKGRNVLLDQLPTMVVGNQSQKAKEADVPIDF
jgi:hypothetical protein